MKPAASVAGFIRRSCRLEKAVRMLKRFLARLLTVLALAGMAVQPVAAQSILRDAETEALFRDITAPLAKAAGLREDVEVVLVNDREINAFVAGGQRIYIHSGLLMAADNVNEVQGVIAHEMGHVASGDVLRGSDGATSASRIMLLSLLLGIAAMAAGSGEAGAGVLAAGQQAAVGKFLAFSRNQEASADQSGARYLSAAGVSGKGLISFFRKLQGQEFRLQVPQDNTYDRTHPLTGDRIEALTLKVSKDAAWNRSTDPALEARFERIKGKLFGYISPPQSTFDRYPLTMTGAPARYARAYAFHKQSLTDKAVTEVDALLKSAPADPFYNELKGQVLLEAGRPADAIPVLRAAVAGSGAPLIASLLGHALIATENPANYAEAEQVLRRAVAQDSENPFAWYQLGVIYAHNGDTGRAALATAEQQLLSGEPKRAMASAQRALLALSRGTRDYLRAQDIVAIGRANMPAKRTRG